MTAHRLGRFGMRKMLHSGAAAVVWEAHDPKLDRKVVLKFLSDDASEEEVVRMMREARLMAAWVHAAAVAIHDGDVVALLRSAERIRAESMAQPAVLSDGIAFEGGVPTGCSSRTRRRQRRAVPAA